MDLFINRLLSGKRIVLVGRAEASNEDWIANAEILVRVNSDKPCHGLVVGGGVEFSSFRHAWRNLDFALIGSDGQHSERNLQCARETLLVDTFTTEHRGIPARTWCDRLVETLNTRPLSGMVAVAYLLQAPFASLSLTGFDFYRKRDQNGRWFIPYKVYGHSIFPQREWLREQVSSRGLIVDSVLSDVLAGVYPPERLERWYDSGFEYVRPTGEASWPGA